MEALSLYDLPKELFESFVKDFGTEIVEFKFNDNRQKGIPCKYSVLKETTKDEQPTLVLIGRCSTIRNTRLLILDKPPRLDGVNEIDELNSIAEIIVEETNSSLPFEMYNKIGSSHFLTLTAKLQYLGVIDIPSEYRRLSNLCSLKLTQEAYRIYDDVEKYSWVTRYFKSADPEIYPLAIRNKKIV